jgi:hypothetical protein
MNYSLQGIRFTLKNASIFLIVYYEQFFFVEFTLMIKYYHECYIEKYLFKMNDGFIVQSKCASLLNGNVNKNCDKKFC